MAHSYRKLVTCKLSHLTGKKYTPRLSYCISKKSLDPEIHFTLEKDVLSRSADILGEFSVEPHFKDVQISNQGNKYRLIVQLSREHFIRNIIGNIPLDRPKLESPPKTVIEFSSPNIAKPFHAGHLRSAIIGNFLANLYDHMGYDVIKINYLGDWGTQFGYLKLGVDLQGLSKEDIKKNPIETLYKAYVYAYKEAAESPELQARARQIFSDLENGTFKDLSAWTEFRLYTVEELKQVYQRLGISFDHYHWESQYGINDIAHVISLLLKNNILHTQSDGRKIVKVSDRNVPIMKSDGTTLYLTRDIAALIDRYNSFKFDNILYVVDNSQSDHFAALRSIAEQMRLPYASTVNHIKFGRVHGMSTRKGEAVFLKDILDEAEMLMKQKQLNTTTTKIKVDKHPEISAILGTTAVIVNDLKQRRLRDYQFCWSKALQTDGDTGIKLQYTHCRLWSLQQNIDDRCEQNVCTPELLPEPEALQLVCEIAKLDDILTECECRKEACILVNYLFGLCNAINRAMQSMNVKNEPSKEKRMQRLLLFSSARKVLEHGMRILGLEPVTQM